MPQVRLKPGTSCLYVSMLYVPVNNISVMLGSFPVFQYKIGMKYHSQGHNTVHTATGASPVFIVCHKVIRL